MCSIRFSKRRNYQLSTTNIQLSIKSLAIKSLAIKSLAIKFLVYANANQWIVRKHKRFGITVLHQELYQSFAIQ